MLSGYVMKAKFFFLIVGLIFIASIAFISIKSQDKKSTDPLPANGFTFTLIPYDMRPLEDCLLETDCQLFSFSAQNPESAKTIYAYDASEQEQPDQRIVTSAYEQEHVSQPVPNVLNVVNARNPKDCIKSLACSWFGFFNAVNESHQPGGSKIIKKWEKDIAYRILTTAPEIQNHVEESVQYYADRIPVKFTKSSTATENFFIIISDNIDVAVKTTFKEELLAAYDGADNFFKMYDGLGRTDMKDGHLFDYIDGKINKAFVFLPADPDKQRKYIYKHLFASLGLDANLGTFPFSFMNALDPEATRPTIFDDYMLYLLYQADLPTGSPTSIVGMYVENSQPNKPQQFLQKIGEYDGR